MPDFDEEDNNLPASEDEASLDNDYYCFLNVPRTASDAQITAAYKKLARLYHPDKHQDPARREEAELLFAKLKNCYEVLTDPHKRAIYDCLGKQGLQEQGWAVVQRTKTPREIREEYEALARVREAQRLQQRTSPASRFSLTVNATDLFDRYLYDSEYDDLIDSQYPQFEVSKLRIFSSIQAPLTSSDTASLSGNLETSNGKGVGEFNLGYKRVTSVSAWQECSMSLGNGLSLAAKVVRKLGPRVFGNMSGTLQFANSGLKPGYSVCLENNLDQHTVGYLTYSTTLGLRETSDSFDLVQEQSGMETMIVRDTKGYSFVGSLQLGIPYTYTMLAVTRKMPDAKKKMRVAVKAGTFGASLEYGIEERITAYSSLGATMVVGFPAGVTVRIKLARSSQIYTFPIHLSDEVILQPIFYGTVVPLLAWFTIKKLILEPQESRRKEAERARRREMNREKVAEARREATASCSLMAERFRRILHEEEEKSGLVIVMALYGLLADENGELKKELKDMRTSEDLNPSLEDSCIDITLPVQCCVESSTLVLWEGSKSNLPGVWDPVPGEEKHILIKYTFMNHSHQIFCPENEAIKLPKNGHRIS